MEVGMKYKVNTGMPGYSSIRNGELTGAVKPIPKGSEVEVLEVARNGRAALVQYDDTVNNCKLYTWVTDSELDLEVA